MKKTWLILTALFWGSQTYAHNVWLENVKDNAQQYVVKFGHTETESYPQQKLKAVSWLDLQGKMHEAKWQMQAGEAHFSAPDAALVFMQFDNGIWSKLPNGKYVEKSKKQAPDAVLSMNAMKVGKRILHWNDAALQAHQQEYELVPQAVAKAGEKLAILVLYQGKPVANIKVGSGEDQPFVLTDEKGIAHFDVKAGDNRVWAEFTETGMDNPDYTERSIEYLLTFDAK